MVGLRTPAAAGPGRPAAVLVLVALCVWASAASPAAVAATGFGGLAAAGGTLYAIDEPRGAIVACGLTGHPPALAPPRDVVAAPGAGPRPVAIARVGSGVLVAVCRDGDAWSLRTWRPVPGGVADPAAPLQSVALGRAAGPGDEVRIAVSPTGDWLAVAGLPPPLPPVMRGAIAGELVAPPSGRNCPLPAAGSRPVAIAVSPADDLVVCERLADPGGRVMLVFTNLAGRELLRLDSGLADVRGIAFDPGSGALLAVGVRPDSPGRPAGLWRLDAAAVDGRQVIRPTAVATIAAPRGIAFPEAGSAVITHGTGTTTATVIGIPPAAIPPGDPRP